MIIDQAVEALKTGTAALLPTATPTPVLPIPSVRPDNPVQQLAGEDGKKTLWVVFVVMVIASAAFSALAFSVPVQRRLYHVITTLITVTAALSYFGMATGHGVAIHTVYVREQHDHVPDTFTTIEREVYWARYVDWTLTTPLLLLDLSLLAGLNGASILIAVYADVVMILTGLFAAFGAEDTPQKWGWYTIACLAYVVVIWQLAVNGRSQAQAKSQKVNSFFTAIAGFTLIIWTAYPIVWGIADGSRRLSVDGEIVSYAVLDVLAKPIFGFWLLLTHANIPETNIDLGGFWSYGLGGEGSVRLGDDDGA